MFLVLHELVQAFSFVLGADLECFHALPFLVDGRQIESELGLRVGRIRFGEIFQCVDDFIFVFSCEVKSAAECLGAGSNDGTAERLVDG